MKRFVRVSISTMLVFLMCVQSFVCYSQTTSSSDYSDIVGHWAKDEITNMVNLGYIKGVVTNDGIKIQPDRNITRAEFVAVMVKILKAEAVNGKVKNFSDVKNDAWYKSVIDIASSNELVEGYPNGTFKPESNISRAEISELVSKLCKFDTGSVTGENVFPDVKESDWFYMQVSLCKKNNIISGYPDNTFKPLNSATRAEAFCMLEKSLKVLGIIIDESDDGKPGVQPTSVVSPTPTSTPIHTSTPIQTSETSSGGNSSGGGAQPKPSTTPFKEGSIYFIEPDTLTDSDRVSVKGRTMEVPSIKSIDCIVGYTDDEGNYKSETKSITDFKVINASTGVYEFELKDLQLPSYRNELIIVITDLKKNVHTGTRLVSINIDSDDDGLLDTEEVIYGTSRTKADTDEDGLSDYDEIEVYLTDPLSDDTDGDGLNDFAELCPWIAVKEGGITKVEVAGNPGEEIEGAFYISPFMADSDEDGLSDYYEVIELDTNPSSMFTLDNPYRDADMDLDKDGLSNIEEFNAGTDPKLQDTDADGLTDGAELKVYLTDPLEPDTDGDGILDGDEIRSGTEPLNAFTFSSGVLDSSITVTQNVYRKAFGSGITSVSDTIELISLEGAPNASVSLAVYEVVYMPELGNIEGIIGTPIDITCDANITSAKLTFRISSETLAAHNLDDLKVFTISEGKLTILDTICDPVNGTISASTSHFSIYGILDIKKLIESLLIGDDERGGIIDKGKADVVFVIDSTGSMGDEIANVIRNVNMFAEELSKNVEVRFGLIDYKDIYEDGKTSTINCGWYTDVNTFKDRVSSIWVNGGGDGPESAVDALEEARRMGFRPNANKFIILLTDADYKDGTRFSDVTTMEQEITLLNNGGIITSVVSDEYYYEPVYRKLYTETDGLFADIYSNFSTVLNTLSSKIKEVTLDGSWVRLSDMSVVKLKKAPEKTDLVTDTDSDGLPDSVELDKEESTSIGSLKVSTWSYFTNPVIKDSDVKIRNVTVVPGEGKAGESYTISADLFSPVGSKRVSKVAVLFKLSNGSWITLEKILSDSAYKDKFELNHQSNVFDGGTAFVNRYGKTLKILDAGKRVFKVVALLSNGSVVESAEHTLMLSADGKLVWKGIDTSKTAVVSETLNLNVRLQGELDVVKYLQVYAKEAYGLGETYFDKIPVTSGKSDYALNIDTTKLANKSYQLVVLGLNASGEVILTTSVYNVLVKNSIAAPEVNPPSGSYSSDITVSMSTTVSGGVIRYTLDGSEPTTLSSVYNDIRKVLIKSSDYTSVVLKAAVFKGSEKSSVVTRNYNFNKDSGWNFADKKFTYLTGTAYSKASSSDADKVFTDKINSLNTKIRKLHDYSNSKGIIKCSENQGKIDTLVNYLIASYDKYYSKEIKAGAKSSLEGKRSEFKSNHESMETYVIELLLWDQKKADKFYDLIQSYRIRDFKVDERLLIPILYHEGTGSFNTYGDIKASDGQHGTNLDFENDVQRAAEGQAIAKLSTYAYYGEKYRDFIDGLEQSDYPTILNVNEFKEGKGRVAQYLNSRSPKMGDYETVSGSPVITNITTHGVYATDFRWWFGVENTFNQMVKNNGTGNISEKYSQYLLANPIPLKSGYTLPGCNFKLTNEGYKDVGSKWEGNRPCVQLDFKPTGGSTTPTGLKPPYKSGDKGPEIKELQKTLDSKVDTSATEVMIKSNVSNYTENFASLTNALVVLYQQQLKARKGDYPSYSSKIEEALKGGTGVVNQAMLDLLKDSKFTFKIKDPAGKKGQYKLNSSNLWEFVEETVPTDPVTPPADPSGFKVYLSPSLQIHNLGVGNYGIEYDRMNEIADEVEKVLKKNGITVYRNNKEWRLLSQKAYLNKITGDSNGKKPEVHFAIHSNAGESKARGMEVYVKKGDTSSKKLAEKVEARILSIRPDDVSEKYKTPDGINWRRGIKDGDSYAETSSINSTTNLIEVAFHTNGKDVQWIIDNIDNIGREIANGIMEYLGVK